jgi:DNA-binding Lrp family transcriptional regulator
MKLEGHFVQVYDECLEQLHLTITEAYVLCHIYGWCKNNEGKVFERKQDELAAQYGISERNLRNILKKLCERGYIYKARRNTGIGYCVTDATNRQNLPVGPAKFADGTGKICRLDRQNLPVGPAKFAGTTFNYIINYILGEYTPARACEYEEKIVEGLAALYQKNGMQYIADSDTTREFTPTIIEKLQEVYGADADLTVVWPAWLAKVWPGADAWQRANFDLPVICSQFNKINNNTKNNSTNGTHNHNPQPSEPNQFPVRPAATLASVADPNELESLQGVFDSTPTPPSRP